MSIELQHLLSVSFSHEYFSSGRGGGMYARPTTSCARLIKLYGLHYRSTENGFDVYKQIRSPSPLINKAPDADLNKCFLDFAVYITDSHFSYYSDIPVVEPGTTVFYFTNLMRCGEHSEEDSESKRRICVRYIQDHDFVPLRPLMFPFTKKCEASKLAVFNRIGDVVLEDNVSSDGGIINHEVDLRKIENGLYNLQLDGVESFSFYADDRFYTKRPFGIIGLTLEEILNSKETTAQDTDHPLNHYVSFRNRSTTWRYFVIPRYQENVDHSRLRIEHENHQGMFKAEGLCEIRGGKKAIVFVSKKQIPLRDTPVEHLELQIDDVKNGVTTLIDNLPTPKPSKIKVQDKKIFSDVFVYI